MSKRFNFQRLFLLMSAAGVVGLSTNTAMAAAYQLWEQDGASVGNYHAGRAAEAPDASIAYYNPAGLVRIHHQEIVVGADPIVTDIKFTGTVGLTTAGIPNIVGPQTVTAQGGAFGVIPSIHYVTPLNSRLTFGLSLVSPFGLKTNYPPNSFSRYAATVTSLQVIDLSPSVGFPVNDKLSLGAGLDIEHAKAEIDLMAGNPLLNILFGRNVDTNSENIGANYGYGFHIGGMYQFNEQTRIGLTYHSKVTFHLNGSSKFTGPLANNAAGGLQESRNLKANTSLPATTTLSVFHSFNPTWDIMGTVSYIQWNELTTLILQNAAGILGGAANNFINVLIAEYYHNTWTTSVGANYHVNEQWMFKGALGYDESPTNNTYRNLQLPDSDRIVAAIGVHYEPTQTLGFDVGWSHFFAMNNRIGNVTQVVGDQTTVTNGSVHLSADVFGLQMKWDIA